MANRNGEEILETLDEDLEGVDGAISDTVRRQLGNKLKQKKSDWRYKPGQDE